MSERLMIQIAIDDSGLKYVTAEGFLPHEIIGALQTVQKILEAQVIQGTLSGKDTDKDNHERNDTNAKANDS